MAVKKYIAQALVKYPILNLCIIALLTCIAIFAIFRLRFDTSLSAFVIANDPDLAYYNKIKEIFQTDETVVIGFKPNDLFSKKDLEFIDKLSKKIETIDGVRNVKSLTTVNHVVTAPGMFEVKALVDKMPENREESNAIKKIATTDYLYIKDLSSSDGLYTSLMVDIKNDPKTQHTQKVVDALNRMLAQERKTNGYRFYLSGDAVIIMRLVSI